jgi:hypothetical protein
LGKYAETGSGRHANCLSSDFNQNWHVWPNFYELLNIKSNENLFGGPFSCLHADGRVMAKTDDSFLQLFIANFTPPKTQRI